MSGNMEILDIVRNIILGILPQKNVHYADMNVLLFSLENKVSKLTEI